jgi:protein translocase SecG subunit
MDILINWVTILLGLVMITAVLLQVRGTGTQLFGQAQNSFRVRRGFERTLFRGTIFIAIVFTVVAVVAVRVIDG